MFRPSRSTLVHLSLLLFAIALVGRTAKLQLIEHSRWAASAQRQHFATAELPAPRGNIYDVRGVPLAMSREMVRLSVAPRELRDPRATAAALGRLGVKREWIARATDQRRAWVSIPGSFLPGDAAEVTAMRGVYTQPVVERVYTHREATRRVLGAVDPSGEPMGGLERTLDSLVRGRNGRAMLARDARGRGLAFPADSDQAPVPGDAVVLTLNQELQEISERALAEAVARTRADGGDLVILDPHDGGIRAMASRRAGAASFSSPIVSEPFEPGSTLKPLLAGSLLMLGRARPTDIVDTENGTYTIEGRTINDVHRARALSLADVLKYSSNIGIVKFVSRLSPREEYETLRDFGFGMPTGVPFPGEAAGMLPSPDRWSRQSPASLAMGYEVAVTPLQLAAAYAAIANGGELLQPAIVREIRTADGEVRFQHSRRVVRRVLSPEVAAMVRAMMVGVVEGGTAKDAALTSYAVAGKSGTARRTAGGRGYAPGAYTASFVSLFPADAPQYVVLVKLDGPRETIFGGTAAAPVSRLVLQAAIAARDAALDRSALAMSASLTRAPQPAPAGPVASRESGAPDPTAADSAPPDTAPAAPIVLSLPYRASTQGDTAVPMRAVPDVRGLPLRRAVHALHRAGFRVELSGYGDPAGTTPVAGAMARPGTIVKVMTTP
jgi:cell division protein FtsI (penicillin-binding protein 3)